MFCRSSRSCTERSAHRTFTRFSCICRKSESPLWPGGQQNTIPVASDAGRKQFAFRPAKGREAVELHMHPNAPNEPPRSPRLVPTRGASRSPLRFVPIRRTALVSLAGVLRSFLFVAWIESIVFGSIPCSRMHKGTLCRCLFSPCPFSGGGGCSPASAITNLGGTPAVGSSLDHRVLAAVGISLASFRCCRAPV